MKKMILMALLAGVLFTGCDGLFVTPKKTVSVFGDIYKAESIVCIRKVTPSFNSTKDYEASLEVIWSLGDVNQKTQYTLTKPGVISKDYSLLRIDPNDKTLESSYLVKMEPKAYHAEVARVLKVSNFE